MFIVRNISGGTITIDDLGLTLAAAEEYDLGLNDQSHEVENSQDLRNRINAGEAAILDPLDGVTALSTVESLEVVDVANAPNWRIFGGVLDQLNDVDTTGVTDGYALVYNLGATEWQAVEASSLGAGLLGLGPWRYATDVTPPPSNGRIEFNNADPTLATKMYVHYINNDSDDLTNFLGNVSAGALFYAQEKRDSTNGWVANITGFADQTTYAEYDVTDVTLLGSSLATNRDYNVVISGGTSITTTDERVGVSNNDTTPAFLLDKLVAGTSITLTENNDGGNETLTITNSSPNVDQNLWETITADSGSTTANTTTDTLMVAGGNGITTSITGDTVTTALTISTINGQVIPTYNDTTRSNKVLSLETVSYMWAEQAVGNNDWIQIGTATDADSGYIVPFDATIVRITAHCENTNNNTKDIDLYINGAVNGSIGQFTGAGQQQIEDVTLNIDVTQGDKLRLRGRTGQGTIQDTVIVLHVKWRG